MKYTVYDEKEISYITTCVRTFQKTHLNCYQWRKLIKINKSVRKGKTNGKS